jgi:hypothetical protein
VIGYLLDTGPAHRDELAGELDDLCTLAPVPKNCWRWVDNAQYKLTQKAIADVVPEVQQRDIRA